ncbi:LOW QUALITY PROTEIN: ankyrin repeat and LEM domain-containing protein 1 [Bufo bufo]|uniref:LOW QUALITY PROTEIN: ankyrin repeat and LEM domain-containing protein 1 n=1 Tax=Bufo bufo TaxID=8384 RepID=UPI001ABDDABC|nr:LOW QUALITY PROTEIN: ankyrin repeat and LEM domain-containing protein 1 [Bufo bufo]
MKLFILDEIKSSLATMSTPASTPNPPKKRKLSVISSSDAEDAEEASVSSRQIHNEDPLSEGEIVEEDDKYFFSSDEMEELFSAVRCTMGIEDTPKPRTVQDEMFGGLRSKTSIVFPINENIREMIMDEWSDPEKRLGVPKEFRNRICFDPMECKLFNVTPKVDKLVAKVVKRTALPFDDCSQLGDPMDRKADGLLKSFWESAMFGIKTNIAATSLARAMYIWLGELDDHLKNKTPRDKTEVLIKKDCDVSEFSQMLHQGSHELTRKPNRLPTFSPLVPEPHENNPELDHERMEWKMGRPRQKNMDTTVCENRSQLVEAKEKTTQREVEDLLQCGADPNLVLPKGIAAIHLASGKESECALRCLTLILQHGGNPNVRSTDDLTPVHVAASWGCCKALLFLLRKGGDPSIQDQDGNTALDLAFMENNRRCVVALQEYKERIPGGCADEIRDCHNNYSTAPDDITELSCISLLLEPTYENSPLSSTKISPMRIFPKTLNPLSHMDDALISSQAEMPYLHTKNESRKRELGCSFKSMSNECELNPAEAKEAVPGRSSSQSGHCTEYFSTQVESDLTLDNSSISKKTQTLVDYNSENNTRNTVSQAVSLDIYSAVQQDLKSHREVDVVCEKLEALDVTSPVHVYTYNKEHSEENMEKTLILVSNVSECKILEAKETCCRSDYSDCNTGLWESGHRRWGSNGMDSIFYDSGDATVLSKRYECKTMNAHSSGLVAKEDLQAVENQRLTGDCTQIVNSQCNRTPTVECTNKTIRTSEVQFTSQSSTVPIENTSEHDGQDLQIHLRDLLLSTKAHHKTGSQAVCANTIPVSGETRSPNQKDASSSSSTSSEGNCFVEYHERRVNETRDSDLQQDLKKMMLATKNSLSPAIANEDKSPFFTPRTKSRLRSFKVHQNSSLLFDDSVEMPKRGRRVRSPGGLASPTHNFPPDEFLPRMSSHSPSVTYDPIKQADTSDHAELTLTKRNPQHHGENLSEAEATISITNFLTDDLSSETEEKSCLQLKQANSNHGGDGGFSDSAWLTEDGESEISGVAAHKKRNVCSTTEEKSLPASLSNRSFFHSTLLEDTVVNSCKPPRYSFSRISLIPRVDGSTVSCLGTLHDSASQEMPLSPGGRPVNVSQVEPVEYLYKDNEKGHVLIEKHMPSIDHSKTDTAETSENTIVYDWRNYKINTLTINKASSVSSPNRVAVELYRLSNDDIASRLRGFGENPGHVTSQNRKMCILLLDKCLKEQTSNRPMGLSINYSPELSLALHTFNISDCSKDEAEISREFDRPDKTRKWREGVLKSSFNYLLLDPRVTRNLPSRCRDISPHDCFRTFVSSVFYVGKGKRSRPYLQHIVDIWKSGQGVLSLHCFQNTIPVEAYTREACMVDAIGLKMLTNQKKGIYYGQAQNWSSTRQQRLGVHILYKAMQIFLAEGERQLRPPDIRSGQ